MKSDFQEDARKVRIAVCKAAGWKITQLSDGTSVLLNPAGKKISYNADSNVSFESFIQEMPNYSCDLNACQELELSLPILEYIEYTKILIDIHCFSNSIPAAKSAAIQLAIKSSALQRCNAYLKLKKVQVDVCCCPSIACPIHSLPPGSASGGW